jgi:hypothetical protein
MSLGGAYAPRNAVVIETRVNWKGPFLEKEVNGRHENDLSAQGEAEEKRARLQKEDENQKWKERFEKKKDEGQETAYSIEAADVVFLFRKPPRLPPRLFQRFSAKKPQPCLIGKPWLFGCGQSRRPGMAPVLEIPPVDPPQRQDLC